MARRNVKDLAAGDIVAGEVYMIAQKELRTTSNGGLYIHVVLADRTGQIVGRQWQATQELYDLLPADGFIRVRGRVESYKNALQFIVDGVQQVDRRDIAMGDFLPRTDKDIDKMFERAKTILRKVRDRNLQFLIKQFVLDEDLMAKFKSAPAAVQMHHAYIGGLLEHTLNLLELAEVVGPRYPQLSQDLMLAGTFLHDIGKLAELTWDGPFRYTDSGQLVGHLLMGAMLIEEKARAAGADLGSPFPEPLLRVLQHMVLSHHGDYEYGSPKLPMTAEAIALHHLDNLDAKLAMFSREVAQSEQSDPGSSWTGFVRALDRKLFKSNVFKAGEESASAPAPNGEEKDE